MGSPLDFFFDTYVGEQVFWSFYKTLFSSPGSSTSSEIPEEKRNSIGLSDGLVRISIGLDNNIERTYDKMLKCIKEVI